ncbi:hypothetical protein DM45_3472 [Burkholderia mallei]|nr:hypothetical protein DM75_3886 [Burkholderia mallei]KOS93731.1 hypothetical protein DM45_3472 [Burkholderia mallei]KOT22924.1 hypothetical protein DM52_2100 [Burkholderia mallei]
MTRGEAAAAPCLHEPRRRRAQGAMCLTCSIVFAAVWPAGRGQPADGRP